MYTTMGFTLCCIHLTYDIHITKCVDSMLGLINGYYINIYIYDNGMIMKFDGVGGLYSYVE